MSKSRQVLGCGTLHHMLRPPRLHRRNIHRAGQHCKVPEDSHSPVSRTNTRYFGGWTRILWCLSTVPAVFGPDARVLDNPQPGVSGLLCCGFVAYSELHPDTL